MCIIIRVGDACSKASAMVWYGMSGRARVCPQEARGSGRGKVRGTVKVCQTLGPRPCPAPMHPMMILARPLTVHAVARVALECMSVADPRSRAETGLHGTCPGNKSF